MDKQEIMAKYTKLIMKELYNVDCYVFFGATHGFRGIFRDASIPPLLTRDIETYLRNPKCSITYEEGLYTKKELEEHAWDTIIHEVTHYAESVTANENMSTRHTAKFKELEKSNLKKIENLRKKFNKKVGWAENFIYAEDEDLYENEERGWNRGY